MTVEYQLTPEELLEAMQSHYRKSVRLVQCLILLMGGGGILMAMPQLTTGYTSVPQVLATVIPYGLLMVFAFVVPSVHRTINLQSIRKSLKHLCAPTSMRLNQDGLNLALQESETRYAWKGMKRWQESSQTIMLYPQSVSLVVVPKRSFTPEQLDEFRTLLSEKIGPAKEWRK
jgi:hypothetical protein